MNNPPSGGVQANPRVKMIGGPLGALEVVSSCWWLHLTLSVVDITRDRR